MMGDDRWINPPVDLVVVALSIHVMETNYMIRAMAQELNGVLGRVARDMQTLATRVENMAARLKRSDELAKRARKKGVDAAQ